MKGRTRNCPCVQAFCTRLAESAVKTRSVATADGRQQQQDAPPLTTTARRRQQRDHEAGSSDTCLTAVAIVPEELEWCGPSFPQSDYVSVSVDVRDTALSDAGRLAGSWRHVAVALRVRLGQTDRSSPSSASCTSHQHRASAVVCFLGAPPHRDNWKKMLPPQFINMSTVPDSLILIRSTSKELVIPLGPMPSSSLVQQMFLPVLQFQFRITEDSYILINTN